MDSGVRMSVQVAGMAVLCMACFVEGRSVLHCCGALLLWMNLQEVLVICRWWMMIEGGW